MKLNAFQKTYNEVIVLDFPGIELEPGKIYAVIGANGSGKSTFSQIVAGIILSDDKNEAQLPGCRVGYLPQKSFAYRMSVQSNITLGNMDRTKADRLMRALQLTHLAQKRADRLSGGETARVALARLLMKRFDLLILDEPTAAMDMESTAAAEEEIRRYREETGACVILVTHSLQQARRMADEALFFQKGLLVETGAAKTVLYCPVHPDTAAFLNFYG